MVWSSNIVIGGVSFVLSVYFSVKAVFESWPLMIILGLLFLSVLFLYLFYQGF